MMNMLDDIIMANKLDGFDGKFFQRELKSLAYFCCREAGWDLYQTYSSHILTFLQVLPAKLMRTLLGEEPPVTTDPVFLEQKRAEVKQMDENVRVKGNDGKITPTLIAKCQDRQIRKAAIAQFNSTVVPRLLNAHVQAQNESLNLIILWGHNHYSCGCYWQERELLKWAKSLGINNLVFEAGKGRLSTWMNYVEDLKSFNRTPASLPLDGDLPACARLAHAQQLNFTIIPGDPMVDQVVPLWQAFQSEYFTVLLALRSGKIPRTQTVKIMGYPVDLINCPPFSGRDHLMASTIKELKGSMVGIYGAAHLGEIHKFLGEHKGAHLFSVTCYDAKKESSLFNRLNLYFHIWARSKLLDAVFGKGCGHEYKKSVEEYYFFSTSPKVIQSIVEDDIYLDS